MEVPKHRFELDLKLGANSMRDLANRLREIADDADGELLPPSRVSGGGYYFTLATDEDMTEELYRDRIEEYRQWKRITK